MCRKHKLKTHVFEYHLYPQFLDVGWIIQTGSRDQHYTAGKLSTTLSWACCITVYRGLLLVYTELRHLTFCCFSGATTNHCGCTERLPGVGATVWLESRVGREEKCSAAERWGKADVRTCCCFTDPDCRPGSPMRSTWHRGSWMCRCVYCLQTPASCRSLSPQCGGNGRSRCLSEWSCTNTHRQTLIYLPLLSDCFGNSTHKHFLLCICSTLLNSCRRHAATCNERMKRSPQKKVTFFQCVSDYVQ